MICRACIRRMSPSLGPLQRTLQTKPHPQPQRQQQQQQPAHALLPQHWQQPSSSFSTTRRAPQAAAEAPSGTPADAVPADLTPLAGDGEAAKKTPAAAAPLSSCPAGTRLNGLNFFKGKEDPVALPDEEYPAWLWRCLDMPKREDAATEDAGDEFSKSKKQRRIALKAQRELEARLVAEGNLEALAPKIPLQHQTVNLPGREGGGPADALAAAVKREELRRAMRRERRAKIKESNYLKTM